MPLGGHGIAEALFVDVDEVVGVQCLQLVIGGVADVYLVVLLDVGPLGLAVKPDGGDRCGGQELLALHLDGTVGGTEARA